MRVQTLGGLGFMPRSFAPEVFHTETGIAIPGGRSYVPSNVRGRGTRGLGLMNLTDTVGTFTMGAVVGGALGFALGALIISWASR